MQEIQLRTNLLQRWFRKRGRASTLFRYQLLQLIAGKGGPLPPTSATVTGVSPLSLVNAVAGLIGPFYRYGWCKHEPHEYLSSVVQQGKVGQNGTPTPDAPVDIVCNNGAIRYGATGNNLAEMSEKTVVVGRYISATGSVNTDVNNFFYQPYIPVTPNTTYTLTASQTCYFISISEYQADKTFIVRNTGSTNITELTITTGADTYFIRFGSNMDRAMMSLEKVLDVNWMLNEGNALPYEPFVGGIITDGTPEVLSVGGVNQWDEEWELGTIDPNTGQPTPNPSIIRAKNFIPVIPSTSYCFRLHETGLIYWYDEEQAFISSMGGGTLTDGYYIFASPANARYVKFRMSSNYGTEYLHNISINLPSTDHDYHPAHHQTAHAENLFAVGDYADTQDIISGAVTRKVGVKVFDGTETFTVSSSAFRTVVLNDKAANTKVVCSHFDGDVTPTMAVSTMPDLSVKGYGPNEAVFFKYSAMATVEDFKAWLADQYAQGTPVIVLYPLADETTETVDGNEFRWDCVTITQASVSDISITTAKTEFTVPSKNHPLNILCNNGVVTASGALGPVETITLSADGVSDQTFTVEDLLGVGDYKDMEEVISGAVTRKCAVCVYDGTQSIGTPYISTTGGLDVGATIVYYTGSETIEQGTPHELTTADGTNTVTSTADDAEMSVTYLQQANSNLVGSAIVGSAEAG